MKALPTLCLLFMFSLQLPAQENLESLFVREIHVANSMGWGFPIGRTSEVFKPKYSTNLGLDIGLKDPKYFFFPSLDFLAFKFDQQLEDPDFSQRIKNANSNIYLLNLAAGRRLQSRKFGFHVYAGPGIGIVGEPRALLEGDEIRLKNQYTWAASARLGSGTHYQLGNVRLFVDVSYLYHFRNIQGRPVQVLTVYGGLRTNVTRVADRVIEIITDQN